MNNDALPGNPSEQLNNNQGVRRWILLGILAAAIIGCLVGSILLIRHYNDPMLTAGDYYDAVARKEWDRLYEMLDVGEDGHFLTRESYFAVMEEQFRDMDTYSIHREGNHVFRMDYVVAGREHATTILLKEQEKKEYLFLTNNSGYTPRELQQKLLVLSRVSTRETISEFAFRPTLVLDGVGSSVEMAHGQKS